MLSGVEKQIADATQGLEKHLAKHGMEKCQVFVPNLACTNFPLTFAKIRNVQRSDAALLKLLLQSNDAYTLKIFRGGGKRCGLLVRNDKIVIPGAVGRQPRANQGQQKSINNHQSRSMNVITAFL